MADVFEVVVPEATVNLVTNPSFEASTAGWSLSSASLTRYPGGRRGAYMGLMTVTSTGGAIVSLAAMTPGAGTPVSISGWLWSTSSLVSLRVLDAANSVLAEVFHSGSSAWEYLTATGVIGASPSIRAVVRDARGSGWNDIVFDVLQLELLDHSTLYCDGDQPGCTWDGTPHLSTSRRAAAEGRGGRSSSLETAGFFVTEMPGIGTPPFAVNTVARATGDGTVYQSTQAKERVLTLTGVIPSTGLANLHAKRAAVLALVNPDVRRRGPTVLRYVGRSATDARQIEAYYEGGLEMNPPNATTETAALRFRAPRSEWLSEYDQSALLASRTSLAGASLILRRTPAGVWETLNGGLVTAPTNWIADMALLGNGNLVVGGNGWTPAAGGAVSRLAYLLESVSPPVWTAPGLALGNPNDSVLTIEPIPGSNDMIVGGYFTNIGGAVINRVAYFSHAAGTWTTVGAGGANGVVYDLCLDRGGRMYAAGTFTTIGGVAVTKTAVWNGSVWAAAGNAATEILHLELGPEGAVYGQSASAIYYWQGVSWVSIAGVVTGTLSNILWHKGLLYAFGTFSAIGGIQAKGVARYRPAGGGWEALGGGVGDGSTTGANNGVIDRDGTLIVIGNFTTVEGLTALSHIAIWNGSSWQPMEILLPFAGGVNSPLAILAPPDGSLTIAYQGNGTVGVPGLTTVTNVGTAPAYPIIRLSAVGYLYSLANLTTGQVIRFAEPFVYAGETLTLDMRPGRKTIGTATRDFLPFVLPGSDIDGWQLAPGPNTIALYCDLVAGDTTMSWTPRHWSAD